MYTDLSGSFSFPVPTLRLGTRLPTATLTPTVEAPKISLGTEVTKAMEKLFPPKPLIYGWPQPKPTPPPIVSAIPPVPVVNIQAAPAPVKAPMPKWIMPAAIGGVALILLVTLGGKK